MAAHDAHDERVTGSDQVIGGGCPGRSDRLGAHRRDLSFGEVAPFTVPAVAGPRYWRYVF